MKNEPTISANSSLQALSTVTVTPCPHGVQSPISSFAVTMHDYENQPPRPEVIGEAVNSVLNTMWRKGFDPAHKDFVLLVTFGSGQ